MIELLKQLIAIPSVSREEGAAADCLQKWMEGRGLQVHRKFNNLWVETEAVSSKPTILLNAHIDTVKPAPGYTRDPFTPSLEGDRLYGLGSNDDGGSLVSLLEVFLRLNGKELPYRLVFSASAEEEVCGATGLVSILPEIGKVELGIIGEPTGMQMAVAEKGLLVLDCTSHGQSGHAARNEGVNALYAALDDIEWFRSYSFPKVNPQLGPVKMTVTIINAGTQHNVVPDKCVFTVDIRPNGEYTNQEIVDMVRASVSCDVQPRSMFHNSSSIPMEHPFVKAGLALGLEAFGSPTTSNQTVITEFKTIKIGPGQSSRSHSADEYICVSEIEDAVDIYLKLLESYGNTME